MDFEERSGLVAVEQLFKSQLTYLSAAYWFGRKMRHRGLQAVMELVRSVLANELHLALVTAPPTDAKLTAVAFAETRLCAVFSDAHAAAVKEQVTLEDFANDEWILLPRNGIRPSTTRF
jgi:hypothetical protein